MTRFQDWFWTCVCFNLIRYIFHRCSVELWQLWEKHGTGLPPGHVGYLHQELLHAALCHGISGDEVCWLSDRVLFLPEIIRCVSEFGYKKSLSRVKLNDHIQRQKSLIHSLIHSNHSWKLTIIVYLFFIIVCHQWTQISQFPSRFVCSSELEL